MICGLVWLQELVQKRHAFETHWIAYLEYGNILNSIVKHSWDNLHDHTTNTRFFTLIMTHIFMRALKITRKVVMASIWSY